MILSNRKVLRIDGQEHIVLKVSHTSGSMDRLLVIGPDGELKLIDVKHIEYLSAKPRRITMTIEWSK